MFILWVKGLFVVLCGYPHKNQCGLGLKIILSIENDEEPEKEVQKHNSLTLPVRIKTVSSTALLIKAMLLRMGLT